MVRNTGLCLFQKIPRPVSRLALELGLGSGPHVVGRLVLGPGVMGRLWSGVWVSVSYQGGIS